MVLRAPEGVAGFGRDTGKRMGVLASMFSSLKRCAGANGGVRTPANSVSHGCVVLRRLKSGEVVSELRTYKG